MKSLIFAFLLLSCLTGQSQTLATDPSAQLKKGFYRTYDEYLKNDPSIQPDFETQLLRAGRKDTTIIAANYILKSNEEKPKKFWGFCDGEHVFVRVPEIVGSNYWKLQCPGPNPYFFYKSKTIYAMGPPLMALATAAVTAAVPASLDMWLVTKSGKAKYGWRRYITAIVKRKPEVYAEYKRFKVLTVEQRLKYLRAANEPS